MNTRLLRNRNRRPKDKLFRTGYSTQRFKPLNRSISVIWSVTGSPVADVSSNYRWEGVERVRQEGGGRKGRDIYRGGRRVVESVVGPQ